MEAKDLMIGDWVYYNNRPVNVDALNFWKIGYVEDGESKPFHEQVSFDPIPLTEEILSKNGWKNVSDINCLYFGDHYNDNGECDSRFQISHYLNEELWSLVVGQDEDVFCNIKYVHEFQHALMMCGFDNNIKI